MFWNLYENFCLKVFLVDDNLIIILGGWFFFFLIRLGGWFKPYICLLKTLKDVINDNKPQNSLPSYVPIPLPKESSKNNK